jgi:hypothetical protein
VAPGAKRGQRCTSDSSVVSGKTELSREGPATLLAAPGVTYGFINNSSAPMVVSGNFPALDVETLTVA